MKYSVHTLILAVAGLTLVACSDSQTAPKSYASSPAQFSVRGGHRVGFGFNAPSVKGFPHGEVALTGGGSYDPSTATNSVPTDTAVASGGGFSCNDTVGQPPLLGCKTGEGVRWDTAQLLASTPFKCTGALTELGKTATTSAHTVVLKADFYRAGDGNEESFKANMIVSDTDLDPVLDGVQNVWIQGVGCGTAVVHFSN